MSSSASVTALILAGGEGRRMGGQDKGWVQLKGIPLVEQVIARLTPQLNRIVISANRNLEEYQALGYPVICDETPFLGPLAGIAAGLQQIETDYALVVPTDAPLIAENLVATLFQHIPAKLVLCEDNERLQPLFGLYHRSLADSISDYLQSGERKLMLWCKQQNPKIVTIGDKSLFTNLNTPEDLADFEKKLPK